jgi:hypothetical protein
VGTNLVGLSMSLQIGAAIAIASVGIGAITFVLLERTDTLRKLVPVNIGFEQPVIVTFMELILSVGVFALLFGFSVRLFKRLLSIRRKLSNSR